MILWLLIFSALLAGGKCLDLDTFYNYLQNNSSSSNPECEEQKSAFLQGLINRDAWAIKMLDSYGRIPQGITQGHIADLGMFDQCLNILEQFETMEIKGKYCYSGLIIPLLDIELNAVKMSETIKKHIARSIQPTITSKEEYAEISVTNILLIAACVPDACLPSELFGELGLDTMCQTKNETKRLRIADYICLAFFVIVAWLMIASTCYDLYLRKKSKEPKHEILLAFSVYTNGKKILKINQDSEQILFFNGMKVLSMFWIIMGHRYSTIEFVVINAEEAAAWKRKWYAAYVLLAPLAVDTFLLISGTLLAYTFLKTMKKPNQKFNIVLYYIHRYIRLTPALAAIYFFQVTLAKRIIDGPAYPVLHEQIDSTCMNGNWWSFFLYVQNYVATDKMCLVHTWYLSVDMQVYILSPLLLLPMHYYGKRITYTVLPFLVFIIIVYTMLIFYFYDIRYLSNDYNTLYNYLTHTRVAPWLIGLGFGVFILDYQANKERYQIKNKWLVLAIWGVVICLIGFLLFYQNDVVYNRTTIKSTFFFSLQKPLWTLCLCWISFACLSGNAGFIDSFLSMAIFQVLSKVTYSTYLIHPTVILLNVSSYRISPYFTDQEGIRYVIGDIFLSYAIGAAWTLAFESPILILEKIIFRTGGERKRRELEGRVDNDSLTTVTK